MSRRPPRSTRTDPPFPSPALCRSIGLRRFSHEPYSQEIVSTPDGGVATGDRFAQTGDLGETIGRGEYQWKMFGGDWQLSGEAAFNTLDHRSEEHTSELPSLMRISYAVFCLKKNIHY